MKNALWRQIGVRRVESHQTVAFAFMLAYCRHMIGIIVITHGALGSELIAVAEHVVGRQQALVTIAIGPEDDIERRRNEIIAKVAEMDTGAGVAILTDMFGGTPSNLAISVMKPDKVEVIAGVNVPMLIKLISVRNTMSLMNAALTAQEAGRKYINVTARDVKLHKFLFGWEVEKTRMNCDWNVSWI
jgi:mannose PTS system EIIA component